MITEPLKWFVGVSFKQELLSEYIIEYGYRYTGTLLGLPVSLKYRKYVDNEICAVKEDYDDFAQAIRNDYQKHLPRMFGIIKNNSFDFINFTKSIENRKLSSYSNLDLLKIFQNFCERYAKSAGLIAVPFVGEMVMVSVLKEKTFPFFEKKRISYNEFIKTISLPSDTTTIAQERIDLLEIATKIKSNNPLKELFDNNNSREILNFLNKSNNTIVQNIENHSSKYIWITKLLLSGENYTSEKVIERLQDMVKSNPKEKLKEITEETAHRVKKINELYSLATIKYHQDLKLFQQLVYFRDVRLMWLNEGCHYGVPLLEEISKRLNLSYEEVIYLMPSEIERGLTNKLAISRSEIAKRLKKYAMVMIDNNIALFIGEEAEQQRVTKTVKLLTELRGNAASAGMARGKVRIIKDRSELHKLNKGEILVTPLTTPDFIIAMEKAAAIITDLGGITSHAAIVSRELKIPCITGTEIATKIFKDGDLIEVDAYNGIVRKL